jgi:hypothetical protein
MRGESAHNNTFFDYFSHFPPAKIRKKYNFATSKEKNNVDKAVF